MGVIGPNFGEIFTTQVADPNAPFGQITSNTTAGIIVNQSGITTDPGIATSCPVAGVTELDGYKEHFHRPESGCVRVFGVPWGNRKAFVDWILGFSTNVLLAGTGSLARNKPLQDAEFPWLYADDVDLVEGMGAIFDNPNLFAVDSNGNPVLDSNGNPVRLQKIAYFNNGPSVQMNPFNEANADDIAVGNTLPQPPMIKVYGDGMAKYSVTFRSLPYEILDDSVIGSPTGAPFTEINRYVIRTQTYALQSIPIPLTSGGGAPIQLMFVGPPPTPVPQAQAGNFLLATKEITYKWLEVPDVPEGAIEACQGHTNFTTFDAPVKYNGVLVNGTNSTFLDPNTGIMGGFGPQTLLMVAPEKEGPFRSILGRRFWNLTYKFLYRKDGWNSFPILQSDGTFKNAPATFGGQANGPLVYPTADFSQLFTMPTPVKYQNQNG